MVGRMLVSRAALALLLAGGATTAALPPLAFAAKKDATPKLAFSPEFTKAAADIDKALSEPAAAVTAASAKAKAAKTPAEKQAADAEVDAALGGGRAKVDAAAAVATTPADKLKVGDLYRLLGNLYDDLALQHKGLTTMLDSGGLQPASVGQVQWLAGVTAYQGGDYVEAVKYLKPAKDSGYKDPQGMMDQVLADAYARSGNASAAAAASEAEITAARAAGTKPSETAIRSALQRAYDAKDLAKSTDLSIELVKDYPSPDAWNAATSVVRSLGSYAGQENLDLMRLMMRAGAMKQRTDYLEYIDNADARRLPGETLRVIDAGVAAGKLQGSDTYLVETRKIAAARVGPDKASLPALGRDARAGSASASTISGAADAFLSYDQPGSAEELYKAALAKPGVDKDRALTRLGIAQVDQGKYADAQQTFAQVGGPRANIAKLWSVYAASKQSGAGAATTPAAG